ncbi:MAG: FGGY-family carbohydrate kinase [bacterium]|nr:FGGY-family carbohydrate kinase [bacterium]
MNELFLGLDLGTQGVRVVVVDKEGDIISSVEDTLKENSIDPSYWWEVARDCLGLAISRLKKDDRILSFAVTSTSGTVVCVDDKGEPLIPALMYNDPRGAEESKILNEHLKELTEKLGYKFNASYALSKILWVKNNLPEVYEKTRFFLSPTDFINLKLTGTFGITDHTNALKFGFDLVDYKWPSKIEELEIEIGKLPKVTIPGDFIGNIKKELLEKFGINYNIPVFTGLTDGTSGQIASGAVKIGESSTTLGTTLVIKGVSSFLVKDSLGRFYSHLHPEKNRWFPGGSSNVGGEALEKVFPGENYRELDKKVEELIPSSIIVYPLVREGERFPFVNPKATGFVLGNPLSKEELYLGYLEGIAYVERLCYEMLSKVGVESGNTIYTVGGGAKSSIWLKIRASIMNKVLKRPRSATSGMGVAILGASKTFYDSLDSAVSRMVKIDIEVEPDKNLVPMYEERYRKFIESLSERKYL